MIQPHLKRLLRFAAASALCLCCLCTTNKIAGGSQVGNPAVAVGSVQDTSRRPVSNARVYLVSPEFNAAAKAGVSTDSSSQTILDSDSSGFLTFTDTNGKYVFHVPQKEFNLYIKDSTTNAVALRRNVAINHTNVDLGLETVKQPGFVIINVPDTMFVPNSYLILPGTPFAFSVPQAGSYTIAVPNDTVSLEYFSAQTNTKKQAGDSSQFIVQPGDTVNFSGIVPVMFAPVLRFKTSTMTVSALVSDTISTSDSSVMFIASGPYSGKIKGLQYQFFYFRSTADGSVTSLSNWSDANNCLITTRFTGQYGVSCRIQINGSISDWITTRNIYIKKAP